MNEEYQIPIEALVDTKDKINPIVSAEQMRHQKIENDLYLERKRIDNVAREENKKIMQETDDLRQHEEFTKAAEGLEKMSHADVVFWVAAIGNSMPSYEEYEERKGDENYVKRMAERIQIENKFKEKAKAMKAEEEKQRIARVNAEWQPPKPKRMGDDFLDLIK